METSAVLIIGVLLGLFIGAFLAAWFGKDLLEEELDERRRLTTQANHYVNLFGEANKEIRDQNKKIYDLEARREELSKLYAEAAEDYKNLLNDAEACARAVADSNKCEIKARAELALIKQDYEESIYAYSEVEENSKDSYARIVEQSNKIVSKKIAAEKELSALKETNKALDENCRTWEYKYRDAKEKLDKREEDLKKLTVKAPALTKRQNKTLSPKKKVA